MTRSAQDSLLVEPAYANFPVWSETFGPEVADLCDWAGFGPDAEQAMALDALFGVDSYGRSVAFEFAIIAARQNLKTGFEKQAVLGWLFVTEQRLITWSAHDMAPTREAFNDLVNLIEGTPALAKRLAGGNTNGVFRGSGQEAIALGPSKACRDGQRVLFKARTYKGGRGLTADKIILDEGFALTDEHMGSLVPTLSAVRDPQMVIGSSACRPESDVLRKLVARGRSTDAEQRRRLGYMEFCAPENACEDAECLHHVGAPGCAMDSREYVLMANPQAGRRISWQYLDDERDTLDPAEYGRERLGWHDQPPVEDGPLVSRDMWAKLRDPQSQPGARVAFGVYVNKLQTSAALGVAGYRDDGKIHVGIVPAVRGGQAAALPGVGWIPARMLELKDAWKPVAWALDDRSAAGSLLPSINEFGVEIENATAADVARACMAVYTRITEPDLQDALRHQGSKPLADSVTAAKMRELADGWAWDRRDLKSDIVQLMAITLAVHALLNAAPVVEPTIHEWPDDETIRQWESEGAHL